jgi:hypothetical protein
MRQISIRPFLVMALVVVGFVAVPAAASAGTATISGKVFYQPPMGLYAGVPGADVTIYNALGGSKAGTVKTNAAGDYELTLWAGSDPSGWNYKIKVEPFGAPQDHKPPYYGFISPAGGTIDLHVVPGQFASLNNFSVRGSTITGAVYSDLNKDGFRQAGEPGVSGADVTINGPANTGPSNMHVATDGNGNYTTGTPVLPSGQYTVAATKAGFTGVSIAAGAVPAPGQDASGGDFGVYWETGTVSGNVYAETNGTTGRQDDEPPIGGADITVAGTYNVNQTFSLATQSKPDGTFSLAVPNGSDFTVTETQPPAYGDGPESTSVGGVSTAADAFTGVNVAPQGETGSFDFGETGATISGVTFADRNQDGAREPGEPPSGGRTIVVAAAGFSDTVVSGPDGAFSVTGAPGSDVTLTPEATADALAPAALTVHPSPAATLAEQNLGYRFVSLNGLVVNRQSGRPVAGVTVSLSGAASRSTTTAADGTWGFHELAAGTYSVHETAPAGMSLATNTVGSLGGGSEAGSVVGIAAGTGQLGSGYELGLTAPDALSAATTPVAKTATKVTIVAGKRTALRRLRLKLGCELDAGQVRACNFVLRAKTGKVIARGRVSTIKQATRLTATLKLTRLGKRTVAKHPRALLRARATVIASQAGGPKLTARKRLTLRVARR